MYRWVLTEELSARQVAKRLNAAGVRPRRARHWVANSVYLILTNPFYSGTACYGRREPAEPKRPRRPGAYRRVAKSSHRIRPRSQWVEVPVPALVTVEEQRRVREQLARNKRRSPRNTRYSYLLRTLVVCGECGWRMQCVRQQSVCKRYQYFYYGCDGRSTVDTGRPERCRAHRVRAERLDAVVWEALASWLENPAMLAREVEAWRAGRSDHRRRDQERGRLEAERRQLERQLERLLDAYQEGAMRIEELKARRARIEQAREQNRLRREEKAAEDQDAARLERISEDLAAFAAALRKGMGELDFAGRQRLVRLLVERVVVTGTDVAIEHVIPLGGRFSGLRPPDGGVLQGAQDRVRL
jgi:site-specific DNA recombinase